MNEFAFKYKYNFKYLLFNKIFLTNFTRKLDSAKKQNRKVGTAQ